MITPRKRPKVTEGHTYRLKTGCGNIYITITNDDQGPFEVFAHLGKTGQCGAAQIEGICRCISIGLRAGVEPESFVKQLRGIRCPIPMVSDGEEILSCADAIGIALSKELKKES